jgi:diguanylate cyclase (GGDEF)-like protein
MAFHALVMACLFAWAFMVLLPVARRTAGAGVFVMLVALAMLTVEFIQYAVLCGACHFAGVDEVFSHLNYSSLYDFILQTILAFGMVMVVMERVQADLETANRELRNAGVRLRELAQFDQMTGALNRNAFEALLAEVQHEGASLAGCVAVLDIDNLKPINDTLGHKTGDRAIQLVAQAVRAIIRPNDLLFRWGGDEFLILWLGNIKKADAAERLRGLNESLQCQAVKSGFDLLLTPSVSWGLATFASADGLDAAVQRADRAMYEIKMSRRSTPTVSFP